MPVYVHGRAHPGGANGDAVGESNGGPEGESNGGPEGNAEGEAESRAEALEEAWVPYPGSAADLRTLGFVTTPEGLPGLLAKVNSRPSASSRRPRASQASSLR